jgi:predicted transcriptional regulator
MPKEAMFTLKLEADLHESFMREAAETDRPASQIVREFMREFVEKQRAARDHNAWFRAEVEKGLREADDPAVQRISHDEVAEKWRRDRAELLLRSDRDDM